MFQADSYQLRYLAHRCSASGSELRGQAGRSNNSSQHLLQHWKGEAAQHYTHMQEQLAADMIKLADALERTSTALQSLASRNDQIQDQRRLAQQYEWQLQVLDESTESGKSEAAHLRRRLHDISYAAEMEARAADELAATTFREIESVTHSLFVQAVQSHSTSNSPSKAHPWWEKAMDFIGGVVYAIGDAQSFGLLHEEFDDHAEQRSDDWLNGKVIGDYIATGLGVVEAVYGLQVAVAGATGGALLSWTGVGAVAGTGVAVAGLAEAAYGAGTAVKGYSNLEKDQQILRAQRRESESEGMGVDKTSNPRPEKPFDEMPFDESGKLKPNIQYKTGEYNYLYETDEMGRISKFNTDDLKLTSRTDRLEHNSNTPGKEPGDHAGHLAGDRFGGSPELDNLVSQSSEVNLSRYKKLENKWAKAIKDGKNVQVEVNVIYDVGNPRPASFDIIYRINGEPIRVELTN